MLHIILFILKLIGFLILGILALLLLLTAVFLLAPFVYRAEFSADNSPESIRGSIRFHWLMHLISGHVSYEDGTFTWHIGQRGRNSEAKRMFGQRAPRNDGKSQSVRTFRTFRTADARTAAAAVRPEAPSSTGREIRKIKTDKEITSN